MTNSIKLIEITAEQAKNHSEREYNPYEWAKIINRFSKYGANFYEYNGKIYAIYVLEGIRNIRHLNYISSLDNGGLTAYKFENGVMEKQDMFMKKDKFGLTCAKELSNYGYVIASVFFNF